MASSPADSTSSAPNGDGNNAKLLNASAAAADANPKQLPARHLFLAVPHAGCIVIYVLWLILIDGDQPITISERGAVVMAAWLFHHTKRILEFLFVHRPSTRREGAGFLLGAWVYYLGMAALIAWGNFAGEPRQHDQLPLAAFATGGVLFAIGEFVNGQHHWILRQQDRSKLPVRGLFPWISAPHYFGELIAWLGFALMCFTWQPLVFFVASFATVAPFALVRHKQYKAQFDDFPANRKALIPFVF